MNVLYLAPGRDLGAADAGTTHTLNITRALRDCGAKVMLAAYGEPAPGSIADMRFISCSAGRWRRLTGFGEAEGPLLDAAREADLIQERAEEAGGIGVRLAHTTGRPLVLEVNTPLSGYPNPIVRRIADWNLRRQARMASAIITQTPLARNIIEEYAPRPVYVVANGADGEAFGPTVEPRAVTEAAGGRRIVAFAGSLRPWHGVEDLIAAGARVLERHREAFFLIVGGGAREEELRSAAKASLGTGNYLFTGAVTPAEVPGWLAAAAVLAAPFSPSRDPVRSKQFARYGMWWSPVKIFEYMAMGKPIVAAAAGMVAEYTAGAALTFAPGDTAALADCISRLLEDEGLSRRLAKAARARFETHYTWRAAARQTIRVWEEVLGGGQKVSLTR